MKGENNMVFIEVTDYSHSSGPERVLLNLERVSYVRLEPDKRNLYWIYQAPGGVSVSYEDVNRILTHLRSFTRQ